MEKLVQDTIVSCDQIKISFLSSSETPCQIGKLVHNLIPAAFSSALSMALQKEVTHIPCTEQELYELTKTPKKTDEEQIEEPLEKTEDTMDEAAEEAEAADIAGKSEDSAETETPENNEKEADKKE